MKIFSGQFIGVLISDSGVDIGRFDFGGSLLADKQIKLPQPPVPGAVTVAICEAISDIDSQHCAVFVGVSLPDPLEIGSDVARVSGAFPGWEQVPLVDWLESRLDRRVVLAKNCSSHYGAAAIALKRFTSFNTFSNSK